MTEPKPAQKKPVTQKLAAKKHATKTPGETATKTTDAKPVVVAEKKEKIVKIPEERREARNAALRAWRAAHAAEQRAYYAAWREKRKAEQATSAEAPQTSPKKTALKKLKKGGKA